MLRFSRPTWLTAPLCLAAINLFTNCAVDTSNVFIALYARDIGASDLYIGFIAAGAGIAFLVSSFVFGRLSDMHGRMKYIRLGLALTSLSFLSQVYAGSPLTLLISRSCVGLSLGINSSVLMAYTYENQKQIGNFVSFGALGWLLGAVIAAIVKVYEALFIISSFVSFFAFLISFFLEEKPYEKMRVSAIPLGLLKVNYKIYLGFFLRQLGGNAIWTIWPLYQAGIGATKTWIAIVEATNMVGQIIMMRFIERYNPARMFQLGLILSAAVFAAYGLANRYWQLVPIQLVLAFAYSSLFVGAFSYLLKQHKEYGTISGLMNVSNALSGSLGPFIGGTVSQSWGYPALMYVGAGINFLGYLSARGLNTGKKQ